jgi:hypothetical protein
MNGTDIEALILAVSFAVVFLAALAFVWWATRHT